MTWLFQDVYLDSTHWASQYVRLKMLSTQAAQKVFKPIFGVIFFHQLISSQHISLSLMFSLHFFLLSSHSEPVQRDGLMIKLSDTDTDVICHTILLLAPACFLYLHTHNPIKLSALSDLKLILRTSYQWLLQNDILHQHTHIDTQIHDHVQTCK